MNRYDDDDDYKEMKENLIDSMEGDENGIKNLFNKLGILKFSEVLKYSKTVGILYLDDLNNNESFTVLFDALKNNKYIIGLSLCYNKNIDFKSLSELLKSNINIEYLSLNDCNIGNYEMEYLYEGLKNNNSIISLNFDNNILNELGITFLSKFLKNNRYLRSLSIGNCNINDIYHLSEGLKFNKTLIDLNIMRNPLGDKGMLYLSSMLKNNKSLQEIDISECNIGNKGMEYLFENLKFNNTVSLLTIYGNNYDNKIQYFIMDCLKFNNALCFINMLSNPPYNKLERILKSMIYNKLKYNEEYNLNLRRIRSIENEELKMLPMYLNRSDVIKNPNIIDKMNDFLANLQ